MNKSVKCINILEKQKIIQNKTGNSKKKNNKKNNTEYLEYVLDYNLEQRYKTYQEILFEIYSKVKNHITLIQSEESAEDNLYYASSEQAITNILSSKSYASFKFIKDELFQLFTQHEKGLALIQMESGMGKTTFVRQMDQLLDNGVLFGEKERNKIMSRAFYCNSVYSYAFDTFTTKLSDILREFKGKK